MCYLTGHGVEQNKNEAKRWLTHAANNGHHLAPTTLQIMSGDPSKGITLEIGDKGVKIRY
jgi:TPR repeat protein